MSEVSKEVQAPVEEIDGYELTGVVVAVQEISAGDPVVAEALLTLIEAGYIELVLGNSGDFPRSA
jgi:hypothetical protein